MMIIGVDYHPSFQAIAFFVEETGECGERELNHSDGAGREILSGPAAARNPRAGRHGGYRVFALVRATAGRVRVRGMDGRSSGDQGQTSEEAEVRPRGCATLTQADAGK